MSIMGLPLVAAVGVGIAVIALFVGLGRVIESRESSIKDRLDVLAAVPALADAAEESESGRGWRAMLNRLRRAFTGQGFAAAAATELARANVRLTVTEYAVLNAGCAFALFLVVLLFTRQPVFACLGAVAGSRLPGLYLRRKQNQRLQAFQDQLPDVLALLVGTLRSGYGITAAMDAVAKQMPSPVSEEFGRVVHEVGLGMPTAQALANLTRRVRSDDLDLVVTAINIHFEVGGNLSQILETISNTIRERVRIKGQLRSLTVQHKLTRYLLTGLPFALGAILYLINPNYMRGLFRPGLTLIIPIASVASLALGWVVMGKLSEIEI